MTRSDLQSVGISLYDLGGPFLLLAVVVCVLMTTSIAKHCIRRRRSAIDHLPGAKLVVIRHSSLRNFYYFLEAYVLYA